jgi:hypothetical protein
MPFYSVYSTPRVSAILPEKALLCCTECSFRNKFISHSWRLKHIKLLHSKQLQVACQKNLNIRSTPRRVEPAEHREYSANKDSIEVLYAVPCLEHVENISDSASQPPPPLLQMEIYPGGSTPLIDYIAEPWDHDAQGFLGTNLQIKPSYPFATREEYKYIQCGIKKNGMKM